MIYRVFLIAVLSIILGCDNYQKFSLREGIWRGLLDLKRYCIFAFLILRVVQNSSDELNVYLVNGEEEIKIKDLILF